MTAIAQKKPESTRAPVPASWLETLGGLFRRQLRSEADILSLVQSGVTDTVYSKVAQHLQLPKDAIGAETTVRNRLKAHSRLNADETERLLMIGRVYAMARDLFGSDETAIAWLHKPARYLRGAPPVAPIELAARDAGVRLLEEKILRTAHGMS